MTARPISTRAGTPVAGTGSGVNAAATTNSWSRELLAGSGSVVPLTAVTVAVRLPCVVGVKLTVQEMLAPEASGAPVGTAGVHEVLAPAGSPAMEQLAKAAALGPAFVQTNDPFTGTPTLAVAGSVTLEACMSARSTGLKGWALVLLAGTGSTVLLLAVTKAAMVPVVVGVNCTVQAMLPPDANGEAVGTLGVQDVVAPAGRPEITHEADVAALGPALVQLKLPDTGAPTVMVRGSVMALACMSARSPGL